MGELLGIPAASDDGIRAFRARANDTTRFVTLIEPRGRRLPPCAVTPSPTPVPALRERADKHYVIRSVYRALLAERDREVRLRADAMSALLVHAWPGNVRQLKNAVAFALATAEGDEITLYDLPEECQGHLCAMPQTYAMAQAGDPDEGQALHDLLRECGWNVSLVARRLGVSRPTVYRRMRRHGLVPPNWREADSKSEP